MVIERLEVEEGFLDGLDLRFSEGLNVIIGPRGSGKTSVIELIRFCFGVEPFTQKGGLEARQHALSVLGQSGRATATVSIGGERVKVVRAADDEGPRYSVAEKPILLSQNEIESVGVDAAGRLRIIDDFRDQGNGASEGALIASIRSLTVQLDDIGGEMSALDAQIDEMIGVPDELKRAEAEEKALASSLAAARREQERLAEVGAALAGISVRLSVFDRVEESLSQWLEDVKLALRRIPQVESWPEAAASKDPLVAVRDRVTDAAAALRSSVKEITDGIEAVGSLRNLERANEVALSDEARDLRKKLEAIHEGAGGASRRVAQLRERLGQLSALRALREEKQRRLTEVQVDRLKLLDQLDSLHERRFREREQVAQRLRSELGPRIDVRISQDAATGEYASAIASALRGSGLHYSNLAPMLASKLAPRELVEAIERNDAALIASIGAISEERARRLVDHMRAGGCEEVLAALVEDAVEFLLLDGKEYKPTESLSTGQRCTVVLPILLTHHERMLVVDEPEAHLDNAFIVGTVIQALRTRSRLGQLIFATHNANIPVLGDAQLVVLLGSSGVRGFVRHSGPLEDQQIVEAITAVMEGGREAFRIRADFYEAHSLR
jgi:ABC-type lipoprotein export system ATPase subunit